MLISTVFLECCLLLGGFPLFADDLSQKLQAIRELVEGQKYADAIAEYNQLLQQAPKSLHGPVAFEIAVLHAALGNKDRVLAMMDQAMKSGSDDCAAVQREELKSIRSDSRFNELVSGIRRT